MNDNTEWMERVKRMTANTVHEAIARLIEEARVSISITHDALGERIDGLDQRFADVARALEAAVGNAEKAVGEGLTEAIAEATRGIASAADGVGERATATLNHSFDETVARVEQQFAVQSDHVLAEVGSLIQVVEERLGAVSREVQSLHARLDRMTATTPPVDHAYTISLPPADEPAAETTSDATPPGIHRIG